MTVFLIKWFMICYSVAFLSQHCGLFSPPLSGEDKYGLIDLICILPIPQMGSGQNPTIIQIYNKIIAFKTIFGSPGQFHRALKILASF